MEHVQPVNPSFSSRPTTLVVALLVAVSLMTVGALVLLFQATGTRPVSDTGRVSKRQTMTPVRVPVPVRPRSRTSVLVLNGNGLSGAAGDEAARIRARGYRHAIPGDAPNANYARSLILYRPGWRREAERLGRDTGTRGVAPLDGGLAVEYARVPLVLIVGGP